MNPGALFIIIGLLLVLSRKPQPKPISTLELKPVVTQHDSLVTPDTLP